MEAESTIQYITWRKESHWLSWGSWSQSRNSEKRNQYPAEDRRKAIYLVLHFRLFFCLLSHPVLLLKSKVSLILIPLCILCSLSCKVFKMFSFVFDVQKHHSGVFQGDVLCFTLALYGLFKIWNISLFKRILESIGFIIFSEIQAKSFEKQPSKHWESNWSALWNILFTKS